MRYLWKFERDIPDDIWAMMLWKFETLERMHGMITALASQEFSSFWWQITDSLSTLEGIKLEI